MNTGISTYIWILNKNKPASRAGKVQLIDASHCFTPRRKSIGTKRNDIADADRALMVQAYAAFEDGGMQDLPSMHRQSSPHMSLTHGQPFTPLPSIMQGQVSSMVCVSSVPDAPVQQASAQQAEAAPIVVVSIHSASSSAIQVFFIENVLRFFSMIISPRRLRRLDSFLPSLRAPARSGS